MILHKYSLSQPKSTLTLHQQNSLLNFWGKQLKKGIQILYTTSELFTDSNQARQKLSISYYPKYDTRFDTASITNFECINNLGKIIDLKTDGKKFTRIWPAFGKTGGSFEFLITKPSQIKINKSHQLYNGGAIDLWHQDSVINYDPSIAYFIAQCVIDVLLPSEDLSLSVPENNRVFQRGNGIVINIPHKKKNLTLSVAWKNLTAIPEFKFWTCIWTDMEQIKSRIILPPKYEKITLCGRMVRNSNLDEFKAFLNYDLKRKGYIHKAVTETIRNLLKNTLATTDEFFNAHSKKIPIQ